jgi:N6-L-threonylcarbamoyladenine synthase
MATFILAIETSCDETSAAVIGDGKILSNVVSTQADHSKYGGVIPELASREHLKNILPVVKQALEEAKIIKSNLSAIAYTQGPGLIGALLVGSTFAQALSLALAIPSIGIDHMKAHVLAHFIRPPVPDYPFLCLTVSGGHTQLLRVDSPEQMLVLGTTQDDAVGESFDKIGKMLGLPYPGGPVLDRLGRGGDPHRFKFPMANMPGLDFSFSGVKTAVRYFLNKEIEANPSFVSENLADLCASVQFCLVETLMIKLRQAIAETGIRTVAIAGGVSANSGLRAALSSLQETGLCTSYIPELEYCTDNAAMVAMAAWFRYQSGSFTALEELPYARQTHR